MPTPNERDRKLVDDIRDNSLAYGDPKNGWEFGLELGEAWKLVAAYREDIQRECVRKAIRWLNVHKGWMGWRDNDVETPSFEAAILDATQVSVESDLNQQSRAMRRGQARRRWLMR